MTAACRYSKWSVKPSRWFVYDSMCLRCFNYNSSLPFSQLEHCSPFTKQLCGTWARVPTPVTPLTGGSDVFCPFFIDQSTHLPCSSNASAPRRWGAETMGDYSEDEIRLWPKTPTNILNPASGASVALWTQNLGIPMAWKLEGNLVMAQDGQKLTDFYILKFVMDQRRWVEKPLHPTEGKEVLWLGWIDKPPPITTNSTLSAIWWCYIGSNVYSLALLDHHHMEF